MSLSDEMRKLAEHLREAYEARTEAVAAIGTGEATRQAEAAEAARQRAGYVDSLRTSVASMRTSIASKVEELREDMGEAHRVWAEFGRFMRKARAGVSAAPAAPRPAKRGRAGRRA